VDCLSSFDLSSLPRCTFAIPSALPSATGGEGDCPESFSEDIFRLFACGFSSCISSLFIVDFREPPLEIGFPAKTASPSPSPSVAENVSWGGDVGGVIGPPSSSSSVPFLGR
jgi:hypothetical protein